MVQNVTEIEAIDKFHDNEKCNTFRIESWKNIHYVSRKLQRGTSDFIVSPNYFCESCNRAFLFLSVAGCSYINVIFYHSLFDAIKVLQVEIRR